MITRRTVAAALPVLALSAALPGTALAKRKAEEKPLPLPKPIPAIASFKLRRPEGGSITLGEAVPVGRPALVSLWATWCAPCHAEARFLASLRTQIPDEELTIIGINVDQQRNKRRIETFLTGNGVNYPQFNATISSTFSKFTGERRHSLPRLFIYDRAGQPHASHAGVGDEIYASIVTSVVDLMAS